MALPFLHRVLSWTEAKYAYEHGERDMVLEPRYPMKPRVLLGEGCDHCRNGCKMVAYIHPEGRAMTVKCGHCTIPLLGGYAELGIKGRITDRHRLFTGPQKWHIHSRDNNRCFNCGASLDDDNDVELEADHIIPHSLGGPSELLNGITLCRECNNGRSADYHEPYVTRALAHTHRHLPEIEALPPGTLKTFRTLKAVAKSLHEWKVIE